MNKIKHDKWEAMRANWVNGNRSYVLQTIANMPKRELLQVIAACLLTSYHLDHQSGDLIDLMEILKQF